ncbi:hypothetical protein MTR67_012602 [Solanum verrucosum]|uniref:Uncharacterized protein n=1 Tax=Solanum verrucosum TaxID=315347 RepID=A0AAF0QA43_SOLVR|nr:hypothetical protein MTR67_012602 [Solanum verrucosum]
MTTQENREVVAPMNPNVGTITTRIMDYTRMNPLEFHGSKAELAAFQLKGIAQVWFNQWKEERVIDADKVSNPKPQGSGGYRSSIFVFQRCGKSHSKKYLPGTDGCFGLGKSGHNVEDCPLQSIKGKNGTLGNLYAISHLGCTLGHDKDHEGSPDVVTDMLKVFHLGVHLIDSTEGGVIVQNGLESSLISDVKAKKALDPVMLDSKNSVSQKAIKDFSQGRDGFL